MPPDDERGRGSRDETDGEDDGAEPPEEEEEVYGTMEPYISGEVADAFGVPKEVARRVLALLSTRGKIREKRPPEGRSIWVREPPTEECPRCGRRFEIRYRHPVLSSVRFCPRCGEQL